MMGDTVQLNDLAQGLSEKIENLGSDVHYKDFKSMRSFKSKVNSRKAPLCLCWLEPKRDGVLLVHIRKGDYSSLDINQSLRIGWGNYPEIELHNFSEIDYVFKLIKLAYEEK